MNEWSFDGSACTRSVFMADAPRNLVSKPPLSDQVRDTLPGGIFTNPTLIELRQEISRNNWLRGAVTSFSALARSVRRSLQNKSRLNKIEIWVLTVDQNSRSPSNGNIN
ncbi:hypothetical protein AVEN_273562-1 [Araneus ventricosus]|uniref:Uncharacterized protein n=1 Tax=Araneus ventricosus TaxID=182803 RepID=A0A4Y2W3K2_ARAVE|nr:hypothetical protein AVEN_273562-1 [Araneus ventricosus]